MWITRRLRRYLFSVFFIIYTDRECLHQISKIHESNRISNAGLSSFRPTISASHADEDETTPTLTCFPDYDSLPPRRAFRAHPPCRTLTTLAYVIRACDYIGPSSPIPGVGLGGLAPSSYPSAGTCLNTFELSPTTPVLGGVPLANDDSRTHRAPIPTPYMIGPITHPFTAPTEEPYLPTQLVPVMTPLGSPVPDA